MKSLIVEDDELSRLLLETLLSQYGVCHVAENGKEAVEAVREALSTSEPYDVMCLDIVMPVLDGQKALREIRKIERENGVAQHDYMKVIMVTAIEDFETISEAFEVGLCEAYLTKPLDADELLEHLSELNLIQAV